MATTDQPSVSPVKALDLRSINNALNEVRQQLITLNNAIQTVNLKAGQNALNAQQGNGSLITLQQQVALLAAAVAALVV